MCGCMENAPRKPYPSDVTDDEWAFVAPYLALVREDAPQREHALREVFNGLRYIVRTGGQWRWMPHDLPPWPTVYQQSAALAGRRRVRGDRSTTCGRCCGWPRGAAPEPTAVIFDSQTLQIDPESGARAGYDGDKRARAARCTWPSTRWGTCWRWWSTPGRRPGPRPGRRAGRRVQEATGDTVDGRLRRPGLHRRRPGRGRRGARHPPGGGQAPRGQARLRPAAPALGGGAVLRLEGPLPAPGPRLRAPASTSWPACTSSPSPAWSCTRAAPCFISRSS